MCFHSENSYEYFKNVTARSHFIITQNALPPKRKPVEGDGVGVVSHHHSESFVLFGEFQAFGDGVVEGDRLMEGHVGPAVVVSLVDTPT